MGSFAQDWKDSLIKLWVSRKCVLVRQWVWAKTKGWLHTNNMDMDKGTKVVQI